MRQNQLIGGNHPLKYKENKFLGHNQCAHGLRCKYWLKNNDLRTEQLI